MWKINKSTSIFITIPFICIGIIFLLLAFYTAPDAKTGDGYPLRIFYLVMGGFFIVLISGIIGGILLWQYRHQKEIEWFKKFGVPGIAEIIAVEQTGVYVNRLPQVQLNLQITTGMVAPYTVTIKKVFDFIEIGRLAPGARLQVLVDPKRPKRILLL